MHQGELFRITHAVQKQRQALLPTKHPERVGQIDPIPALLQSIGGHAPANLPLQNLAGFVRPNLREGAHLHDKERSGPEAGFNAVNVTAL